MFEVSVFNGTSFAKVEKHKKNYVISKLKPREKKYLTNEIDSSKLYGADNQRLYTP